jgi:hypothetical protein
MAGVTNGITAKTGNAKITKLGHTAGNQYGQNPDAQNTKRQAPTEKSAK